MSERTFNSGMTVSLALLVVGMIALCALIGMLGFIMWTGYSPGDYIERHRCAIYQ